MDGDAVSIVLQYTTLHESVRLLLGMHGKPLAFSCLRQFLSSSALENLMLRLSNWMLFCPTSIITQGDNPEQMWKKGSIAVLQRCEQCHAIIRWKNPGWTPDANLLCWLHYRAVHHNDIKTATELSHLCGTLRVPRPIKRKYQEMQLLCKKTAIGANLYYIKPIYSAIMRYERNHLPTAGYLRLCDQLEEPEDSEIEDPYQ
jgi:hypothetical protein